MLFVGGSLSYWDDDLERKNERSFVSHKGPGALAIMSSIPFSYHCFHVTNSPGWASSIFFAFGAFLGFAIANNGKGNYWPPSLYICYGLFGSGIISFIIYSQMGIQ